MNRSGESVSRLVKLLNINIDDLLVIYDDMDLPLGKIRIRQGGSSAGHKGMNSIIQELGRQDFPRLRIGIGHPGDTEDGAEVTGDDIIEYLLSNLPPEEKKLIDNLLPLVSEAVLYIITQGLTAAMNKYNRNHTDDNEGGMQSNESAP
jgi:PTH1 family peptidyl-tRNA hydrolase